MKKLIILMALLFTTNIYALPTTYYTDFKEYGDFSEQEIQTDELTRVSRETRYKYYNETRDYGGYYIEGSNDLNYPYIDYNDYQFTPISAWSYTRMEDAKNRTIEEKNVYEFADLKEVRYIHLYNVSGSYGAFRLSELNVHIDGLEIPYKSICNNCNQYFQDFINNGIIDENMSVIYNGGSLTIDLGDYYKLDSIDFDLYLYDVGYDPKIYSMAITRDSSLNDIIYSKAVIYNYFTYNTFTDIISFNYNINNMTVGGEYYPWIETDHLLESSKTRLSRSYNLYRYQDILYRYYNINKIYSDTYMKEATIDYPYMSEDYKYYYQSSTRDKIVLDEPININSKDIDLNSFILEATKDVSIDSNVDYSKNGVYRVTFKLGDTKIDKEVTIDIPENIVVESTIPEIPKEEIINHDSEKNIEIIEEIKNDIGNVIVEDKQEEKVVDNKFKEPVINEVKEQQETKKEVEKEVIDTTEELPIQKKSLVAFNVGMITIILSIIMGLWIIILSMKKNSN